MTTDAEREAQIRKTMNGDVFLAVDQRSLLRLLDEARTEVEKFRETIRGQGLSMEVMGRELRDARAEIERGVNTMLQQADKIMEQQREIARLTPPPGASAMERVKQIQHLPLHGSAPSGWQAILSVDNEVHIIPINDVRHHDVDWTCWCKPREDDSLAIHNSADGREKREQH